MTSKRRRAAENGADLARVLAALLVLALLASWDRGDHAADKPRAIAAVSAVGS